MRTGHGRDPVRPRLPTRDPTVPIDVIEREWTRALVATTARFRRETTTRRRRRPHPPEDSVPPFVEHLAQIIDTLDEVWTAEAHGAGTLRRWSFAMLELHESRDAWLINHWGIM